jgi:hypothetical protein
MNLDSVLNFGGNNPQSFDPTQPLPFDPARSTYGTGVYKANSRAEMAKLDFVADHNAVAATTLGIVIGNYNADPLNVTDSNITGTTAANINLTSAGAFTFGDGTTTVTLTCNQLPYNTVWRATGSSAFRVAMLRLKTSDVNQFDKQLKVRRQTMFGYTGEQTIVISNFIDPDQNQANIVDIPTNIVLDAETGIYCDIINDATLTFSLFISEYIKPASKDAMPA